MNIPAFPVLIVDRQKELEHFNGMTLRDYFAAKAMSAYMGRPNLPVSVSDEELATACYQMADAMMKARQE